MYDKDPHASHLSLPWSGHIDADGVLEALHGSSDSRLKLVHVQTTIWLTYTFIWLTVISKARKSFKNEERKQEKRFLIL